MQKLKKVKADSMCCGEVVFHYQDFFLGGCQYFFALLSLGEIRGSGGPLLWIPQPILVAQLQRAASWYLGRAEKPAPRYLVKG